MCRVVREKRNELQVHFEELCLTKSEGERKSGRVAPMELEVVLSV